MKLFLLCTDSTILGLTENEYIAMLFFKRKQHEGITIKIKEVIDKNEIERYMEDSEYNDLLLYQYEDTAITNMEYTFLMDTVLTEGKRMSSIIADLNYMINEYNITAEKKDILESAAKSIKSFMNPSRISNIIGTDDAINLLQTKYHNSLKLLKELNENYELKRRA